MAFEGLISADFDAFEEKKWSSHAFNRERLEIKLKLNPLGKYLAKELEPKLPGQEMGITEERPSIFNQHQVRDLTLYFFRDEQSRRALGGILDKAKSIADNVSDPAFHHRHINLGVRVHSKGVETGLWLHRNAWVDWKNVVQRCQEYWERDKLSDLLTSLPPSIRYSRISGVPADAQSANSVNLEEILENFDRAEPWSFFGEALERSDPALGSEQLPDRLAGIFGVLVPLHDFICWRRDNDFHELKEVMKEQKEKAKVKFTSLQVGDEVRILKGLASGRLGVLESIERKGVVKVRIGNIAIAVNIDELVKP